MSRFGRQVSLRGQADRAGADAVKAAVNHAVPFVGPWLAWIMVPWLAILARLFIWATGTPGAVIAPLACVLGTGWLIRTAWRSYGERSDRDRRYATAAVGLSLTWVSVTTVTGLIQPYSARWMPWVPNPWVWGGWAFLGVVGGLTLAIKRAGSKPDAGDSDLAEALGLAKVMVGRAVVDGARIEIPLTARAGATDKHIQAAREAVEAYVGTPSGASRIVSTGRAGRMTMVLVTRDVLGQSIPWSGLERPGGSIVDGVVLAAREDDHPSRLYLTGPSTTDTHVGVMGITRSGKTLTFQIHAAELMSRRDVCVIWVDPIKCAQTMDPIVGGLTLAADTPQKVKLLLRGLRSMTLDRARRMGACGYRVWTPAVFEDARLRFPAVVVQLEEADQYIDDDNYLYLISKGLSLGIYVITSLQRADATSMPTTGRYNIGTWFCFGTGDGYSARFALSDSTIDAGADPEAIGITQPGRHFAELATEPRRDWPVPRRGFFATDDQLRAAVEQGAPHRASLPISDQRALGQAWEVCQPANVITVEIINPDAVHVGEVIDPTNSSFVAGKRSATVVSASSAEDEDMDEKYDMPDKEDTEAGAGPPVPGGPRDPIPPAPEVAPEDDPLADDGQQGGEVYSQRQAQAMVDGLITRAAQEGRTEITVGELLTAWPYRSLTWFSRRLAMIVDGRVSPPPGVTLERIENPARPGVHFPGRYRIVITGIVKDETNLLDS